MKWYNSILKWVQFIFNTLEKRYGKGLGAVILLTFIVFAVNNTIITFNSSMGYIGFLNYLFLLVLVVLMSRAR